MGSPSAGDAPAPAPPTPELLLIEDSAEYALLVEQMIRSGLDGARLTVVETLAEGIQALRPDPPDCVLLDLTLPDARGLEGLQELRRSSQEPAVVVLTGHGDEQLAMRALHAGAQDYLGKSRVDAELLSRSVRYAIERKRAELELAHQAHHDPLTGLPNRILLMDRLQVALARAERSGVPLSLLFCDLDRFKLVNDSLGHSAGDELLRRVAIRLEETMRDIDTVARFGGDEFVILCDGLAEPADAAKVAERIRAALDAPFEIAGQELHVGASFGIARADDRSVSPEDLLRDADHAMFQAKQRGLELEFASPEARTAVPRRLGLEAELRRAVERGEFRLHYQPQVDLTDRTVLGVEALLRWQHPDRGLLVPEEFIEVTESNGLIVPIGEWVIAEACRQLATWQAAGVWGPELRMSVNLSPRQLGDVRLVETVTASLADTGVPAGQLCLEITERSVASDPGRSLETLRALREAGTVLAIDDFGIGQSSLSVVADYPFDVLKIDRSFVQPLSQTLRPRRIFAAVLGVARALGMQAVAEGIESREQLEHVAHEGCEAAQGFLFAGPAPATAMGSGLLESVDSAFG